MRHVRGPSTIALTLPVPLAHRSALGEAINTVTDYEQCPEAEDAHHHSQQQGHVRACPLKASLCHNFTCKKPSCRLAQKYCHSSSSAGVRARQLCPITCGCDDPLSPLALFGSNNGCPSTCLQSGAYLKRIARMPCEDAARDAPQFNAFLDSWDEARLSWASDTHWNWTASTYVAGFRSLGCAYLSDVVAVQARVAAGDGAFTPYPVFMNLCVAGASIYPLKPLSYFCPVACGCHAGDPHCPQSCPARTETTPLCPAYQRDQLMNFLSDGETCPVQPVNRFLS